MVLPALPALILFVVKLLIVWVYRRQIFSADLTTRLLLLFVGIMALHSLAEVGQFIFHDLATRHAAMDLYYVASFLGLAAGASFSSAAAAFRLTKWITALFFGVAAVSSMLVLYTDLIVVGYQPMGSAMTKIPGPAYAVFSIFALASTFSMVAFFLIGSRHRLRDVRLRCRIMLFCVSFFVASIVFVVIAQALGASVSASIIVPASMTFFLWVISHAATSSRPFDIKKLLPLFIPSKKREFAFDMLTSKMTIKEARSQLEEAMIRDALRRTRGHRSKAAELLGISKSNLSMKMSRSNSQLSIDESHETVKSQVR